LACTSDHWSHDGFREKYGKLHQWDLNEEAESEGGGFPVSEGLGSGEEEVLYHRKCKRNSAANRHLKEFAGRAGIEKRITLQVPRNAAAWKLYQTCSRRTPSGTSATSTR
jgi:hypothetical protein